VKEKDEKMRRSKKKKLQTQTRKRKEEKVFSTTPFFVLSLLNQNPHQRARVHSIVALLNIVSSLLSALLRFSFFSLGVFIRRTSRWSRARARIYISRNARSRRVSLERRDEKKREKERKRRARETTIPEEKGKRKKERSNRFFGAKVV
jgi:hypothetical protein